MINEPIIEFKDVTKRFDDIVANDNISCEIRPGEIHAFLGENGAGKTTLMKILMGLYKADSGKISLRNKEVTFSGPEDAIKNKIGMVFQNLSLIPSLTVAENIQLGNRSTPVFLSRNNIKINSTISFGFAEDHLSMPVYKLSRGERQRLEIFKLLYKGTEVLILDEPTSVLTPKEAEELFIELKRLKEDGKTIIIITHKLAEVLNHADRITVLRKGKSITTISKDKVDAKSLARLMVGQDLEDFKRQKSNFSNGKAVLNVKGISTNSYTINNSDRDLHDISFELHGGEIFGIAGVAGNGQNELVNIITGKEKRFSGRIMFRGRPLRYYSMDGDVAYVPENPREVGVAGDLSLLENLMLREYKSDIYKRVFLVRYDAMEKEARLRVEKMGIQPTDLNASTNSLSGGNLQKLVLSREFCGNPSIIIAINPTSGLDIKAADTAYRLFQKKAEQGCSVLLVSHDLDEIITLCDRVMVLYKGRNMGILENSKMTLEKLGLLMGGHPLAR